MWTSARTFSLNGETRFRRMEAGQCLRLHRNEEGCDEMSVERRQGRGQRPTRRGRKRSIVTVVVTVDVALLVAAVSVAVAPWVTTSS